MKIGWKFTVDPNRLSEAAIDIKAMDPGIYEVLKSFDYRSDTFTVSMTLEMHERCGLSESKVPAIMSLIDRGLITDVEVSEVECFPGAVNYSRFIQVSSRMVSETLERGNK